MAFRERAITALAYVTGARGPLRSVFDWLRRHGIGERVIKSALAAALSYWLARFLPDNSNPILAPLTAVFSINLTIAGGMRDARERMLGVLLGIALALLMAELLGPGSVAIGLVVLVSFYVGRRLGLAESGVQQIAVSALLVVLGAAGSQVDNVAMLHLANTLIGTGVGLLLNASVAPPNFVPRARSEIEALGQEVESLLVVMRDGLLTGISYDVSKQALLDARQVAAQLQRADLALATAAESLSFNLMGSDQRRQLESYRRIDRALEHTAIQTRIIARTLADATQAAPEGTERPTWLEPEALGGSLAAMLDEAIRALRLFMQPLEQNTPEVVPHISIDGLRIERRTLYDRALDQFESLLPSGWILLGELVGITTQLVADLEAASTIDSRHEAPGQVRS